MLKPIAYHRKLEGKSNSHLFTFSDGNDYVVKFFQPGFEKSLPNEWIGYCLARYLQLPVPFATVVNIPIDDYIAVQQRHSQKHSTNEDVLNGDQKTLLEITRQGEEWCSQIESPRLNQLGDIPYQFASIYIPNSVDGHHVSEVANLTNSESMARIILFDYWLSNQDRTRKNILFHKQDVVTYTLLAIDQAEVLGGYNWSRADLNFLPKGLMKSSAHKMMASFIKREEEFHEQLEVIQTMPILLIEEIVDLIPKEWGVTTEERKAIVSSLLYRRRKILPKQIGRFIKRIYRPMKELE